VQEALAQNAFSLGRVGKHDRLAATDHAAIDEYLTANAEAAHFIGEARLDSALDAAEDVAR